MKQLYKYIALACFLLISLMSKAQESKVLLDKTYKVNKGTVLSLDNEFGNINISQWDRQEFAIKIRLNMTELSEKESRKILEKVKIEESAQSDIVTIITQLKKGQIGPNGSGKKFEINYDVKVPDLHPLIIKNSFGNFTIQNYNGPIDLHLEYGNISIGNVKELKLKLAFGNGNIQSVEEGDIKAEYADRFNLAKVNSLTLENSYSKMKIAHAGNIAVDGKYAELTIGEINVLTGEIKFSEVKIEQLNKTLELKGSYFSGSLEVNNVSKDFSSINLDTEFSGIDLNFESGVKIPMHIKTSFGDFKYANSNSNFTTKVEKDFNKEFEGTIGSGKQSKGGVTINASYGTIKIKIN